MYFLSGDYLGNSAVPLPRIRAKNTSPTSTHIYTPLLSESFEHVVLIKDSDSNEVKDNGGLRQLKHFGVPSSESRG